MNWTETDIKRIAKEVFTEELKKGIKIGENSITINGDDITFSDSTTQSSAFKWVKIATHNDNDTSTTFNWNDGSFSPTYDVYKIIFRLGVYTDMTNFWMTINNNTSSNYKYLYISDTNIHESSGVSQFSLAGLMSVRESIAGEIFVKGKPNTGATTFYPSVAANIAGDCSYGVLIRGQLAVDVDYVNQFRIWGSAASVGNIVLYGMNF